MINVSEIGDLSLYVDWLHIVEQSLYFLEKVAEKLDLLFSKDLFSFLEIAQICRKIVYIFEQRPFFFLEIARICKKL